MAGNFLTRFRRKHNLKKAEIENTRRELRLQLSSQAEYIGWHEAVYRAVENSNPLFKYITDERAADWRFLLPYLSFDRVLCLGGALSSIPLVLAVACKQVVVICEPEEAGFLKARVQQESLSNMVVAGSQEYFTQLNTEQFDLVAVLRPAPDKFRGAFFKGHLWSKLWLQVKPGGYFYLEVAKPALLRPPALLKLLIKLKGGGCIHSYWPKPDFYNCVMLIPLDNRNLQLYYLNYLFFNTSPRRRWLRRVLTLTVRLNLFELTLPCYSLVAQCLSEAKR